MSNDRAREREHSVFATLVWWTLLVLLVGLAGFAVLFCYFALPKLEHAWAVQGVRPPSWGLALLGASRLAWRWRYVLLLLVPLLFLRPRSRPPAEPRD